MFFRVADCVHWARKKDLRPLIGLIYSSSHLSPHLLLIPHRYSFMRRNVRRLNREIGHHAASLTNPTAVIPLSVPSSYQPRKPYEKKSAAVAVDALDDAQCGDSVSSYTNEGKGGKKAKAEGAKKKGVRKAVNLSGAFDVCFAVFVLLIFAAVCMLFTYM